MLVTVLHGLGSVLRFLRNLAAALVIVGLAVWIFGPAFSGYHIGWSPGDLQCVSRVFHWCK